MNVKQILKALKRMRERANEVDSEYGNAGRRVPEKDKEIENNNNEYTQWLPTSGGKYIPIGKTIPELPPGTYSIIYDDNTRQYVLRLDKMHLDDLFVLPDKIIDKVLYDIKTFWGLEEKYKKYNYVYKRGILLYGEPGNGKTAIIMLLAQELIKNGGIVINFNDPDNIFYLKEVLINFKKVEPNRKVIIAIEDIDNFMDERDSNMTEILNLLDGGLQMPNIVVLATTNYPEKLQRRISHRPSRFDRRYEIGIPSAETRRYYIERKVKKDDLEKINLDDLVKKTDDFTLDHLKELILSIFVLGYDPEEAYSEIKEMIRKGKLLNKTDSVGVGFNK